MAIAWAEAERAALVNGMSGARIALGIFRNAYGYEVRWRERGKTRTKRLPLDAELDALKAFRDTKERLWSRQ